MPNPTKPTTNLTREELEMQSSNSLESEGIKRRGFMSDTTRKDNELRMEIIRKTSTRMSLSDVDIVMQIVKQCSRQERIDEVRSAIGIWDVGVSAPQQLLNRLAELTALKDKQETKR